MDAATEFDLPRCRQLAPVDRVTFLPTVDSTNTAAIARAACDAAAGGPLGSELFLAGRQTAGRGRGGNAWWSAPGALAFSLLSAPVELSPQRLPLISLAVGAGLCVAVERLLPGGQSPRDAAGSAPRPAPRLKWPNDVYLAGKKVAGVLIEAPPQRPTRLVIGVGMNVNNRVADAPPDVRRRAVSLREAAAGSGPLDLTAALIACACAIDDAVRRLQAGDARLAGEWQERSLLTGMRVRVERPGAEGPVEGVAESIAPDGALLVRTAAGVRPCYAGVVTEFAGGG
ncbi:MAG: biotin--[acetyl-CoA-carboxylase] ligase [Planctomycetota bacterium]